MKRSLIILIVLLLVMSCSTTSWNTMKSKEKIKFAIVSGLYVVGTGGLIYWMMNPSPIPDNWSID